MRRNLLQVKQQLGQDTNVRFVFATVDPQGDTPQVLKQYLGAFDPAFIGVTGSLPDLERVWQDYGITVIKADGSSPENYAVDHTDRIYVIDLTGKLVLTYPSVFETGSMVEDLRHLARVTR